MGRYPRPRNKEPPSRLQGRERHHFERARRQRLQIVNLVGPAILGFKLQGARAARATVQFSLQSPPAADLLIPARTVVRTQEVTEPMRFQLLAPLVIAAGTPVAIG